jgi:hypothetical protein
LLIREWSQWTRQVPPHNVVTWRRCFSVKSPNRVKKSPTTTYTSHTNSRDYNVT